MITELFKKRRVFFDGGLGTQLQALGLEAGQPPETWNLLYPERVTAVHKAYVEAGCDVIAANTFGISAEKYDNWRELLAAAVDCARKAAEGHEVYVALDLGPTGHMLVPLGDLAFEGAVEHYALLVREAVKLGVDLILIETMNDCLETKAAVVAAKENSALPVIVTNVYDENGTLMTGASPEAMTAMLEGLRVDALGINCSLGPDVMLPVVERLTACTSIPVVVCPNAGLPSVTPTGETVYSTDADSFAEAMCAIARAGAAGLGGCCGTTPEYIAKLREATKDIPYDYPEEKHTTLISSGTQAVKIGCEPILIGERINPTGKPKLKDALRSGNMAYILAEGLKQAEAGVQVLDVNVGLPEIDEREMMCRTVAELQAVCGLPLQLDSSDPSALEAAMRIYNGKPLVNSVNGSEESMKAVLPLVARYGGAVIALTMDENGIPATAGERVAIAKRIIERAAEHGIAQKDIIVDPLTLTVSADQKSAGVTLEAVRQLRELGIRTSLGVSNISFGLPRRDIINAVFFAQALENGLDCAIMNPFAEGMMNAYRAHLALHDMDTACAGYIAYAGEKNAAEQAAAVAESPEDALKAAVIRGTKEAAVGAARTLLQTADPLEMINSIVIPALNEIGAAFEAHKAYLPQLLMSAEAASAALELIKEKLPKTEGTGDRRMILATVRGDIHDIGKNIVRVLLESYGFTVSDLGRDVEPQRIVDAALSQGCRLVGLSALMTTTVPAMAETIGLLHNADASIKVVVGGAVLTQDYADMIGADKYAADAMDTVRYAELFYAE